MRAFIPALLAAIVFAEETEPTAETPETTETAAEPEVDLTQPQEAGDIGFTYKSNGDDWGEIESLCANGKEQSPIDLNEGAEENSKMEINGYGYMNYPDGKFITHKGNTLQMDFTDGEF